MMMTAIFVNGLVYLFFIFHYVKSAELTFELPDRDRACYHQKLTEKTKSTLEFQVITGGKYDVDVILSGPNGEQIYKVEKKQYDNHEFVPAVTGVYRVCFSNEFSTFTHKVVYFDWQEGPEKKLNEVIGDKPTALTQMESSAVRIHESLRVVEDYQTNFRNREMQGRSFAEDLNERIMYWSIGEAVIILLVMIGQVMLLKSFFTEKKASGTSTGIHT